MKIHCFAWREAGREDGIVWLDLFTAGCSCTLKDRPAYAPSSISVSSHLPGLGCKKALPETRLKKSLIILLAAGVQAGSLILLFSYYLSLRRKRKRQRSLKTLVFMFFGTERSELSSSLNTDFRLALLGQFRSQKNKKKINFFKKIYDGHIYIYVYDHH